MTRPNAMLELDPAVVRRARSLARKAAAPVVKIARSHTTVSVERATLRLAGLAGADHERVPWVNHLVTAVRDEVGLEHGVTTPVYDALLRGEAPDLDDARPEGRERQRLLPPALGARGLGGPSRRHQGGRRGSAHHRPLARHARPSHQAPRRPEDQAVEVRHRRDRQHLRRRAAGEGRRAGRRRHRRRHPLDRAVAPRLRAARRDHRGLRRHLRDAGELPHHARRARRRAARSSAATSSRRTTRRACACPRSPGWRGVERLDMLLNDAMYGILFRDINPCRTFVDQYFSRQVIARAGIIINTGEDNYLTTADAVEKAHTVPSSSSSTRRFAQARRPARSSWASATPSRSTPRSRTASCSSSRRRSSSGRSSRRSDQVDAADEAQDGRHLPQPRARRMSSTSSASRPTRASSSSA